LIISYQFGSFLLFWYNVREKSGNHGLSPFLLSFQVHRFKWAKVVAGLDRRNIDTHAGPRNLGTVMLFFKILFCHKMEIKFATFIFIVCYETGVDQASRTARVQVCIEMPYTYILGLNIGI
jgi:hypothetical protein